MNTARPSVGALVSLSVAALFSAGCHTYPVEITTNEYGSYKYAPGVVQPDATVLSQIVFQDTVGTAAHRVEIWQVPPITAPASATNTFVTSGLVLPNGEWTWSVPMNTYAPGDRFTVNDPYGASGGNHGTEHGSIRFK